MAHGNLVWSYYQKLIKGDFENLKLPDWFKKHHEVLVSLQLPLKKVKNYIIYHDCGKHLCEIHDEKGVHYPNHENVSADYWIKNGGDELVSKLIRNDMFFHTCTAIELDETNLSEFELATLLVSALAEIHANAEIFGGIDSQSFKIKYKQIDRRGKNYINKYINNAYDGHIYCFTRNSFIDSQRAIQLCHVCIESQKKFNLKKHPSLVALVVKSETKLKQIIQECIDNEIDFVIFRDDLHNNEITAVATEPLHDEKREIFKRYSLL